MNSPSPVASTLIGQKTTLLTTIPKVEQTLLALPWRANVLVRCAYARTNTHLGEKFLMPNALVRLYSRGPSGMRAEVARGRINWSCATQGSLPSLLGTGIGPLGTAQAVIATGVPSGGEGLELTWQYDFLSYGVNAGLVNAQFDISGWGLDATPGQTDDAPPPQSVSTFNFGTGQTSGQVAPFGDGLRCDSYLIEALFANAGASDAFVYFADGAPGIGGGEAIRVPAGGTASYTPRRPLYFASSQSWVARTEAGGPSSGAPAEISAQVTWV